MTRAEAMTADALFWLTRGNGSGVREIWIEQTRYWIPAGDHREFTRKLRGAQVLNDGALSFVPRMEEDSYFTVPSSCLWVRVETRHAAKLLAEFQPQPTLILRDGDTVKRTALWWLDQPLSALWALRANERLSQALKGIRKCGAQDELLVPPEARTGAQTVVLESLRLASFHPNQIVGSDRPDGRRLKDAPDLALARRRREEKAKQEALAA